MCAFPENSAIIWISQEENGIKYSRTRNVCSAKKLRQGLLKLSKNKKKHQKPILLNMILGQSQERTRLLNVMNKMFTGDKI